MHVDTHTMQEIWAAMTGHPAPTLQFVAEGLAREPRWLNRTIRPWSTLQHLLACDVAGGGSALKAYDRLALLFHDAEDMLCGDVPSPVKTLEQALIEEEIRRFIWEQTLRLPYPSAPAWERVTPIDHLLRKAEAQALAPTRVAAFWESAPDHEVVDVVLDILDMNPREQVFTFVDLVTQIRQDPSLRPMEGKV